MTYEEALDMENVEEGKVMICTARDCKWNDEARCVANDGIMVNFHQDHADCNTYTKNTHVPGDTSEIWKI